MIYDKVRTFFTRLNLPTLAEIDLALKTFSIRTRFIIFLVSGIFLASCLGVLQLTNRLFIVPVAAPGGSLTEGIIGAPRFINPLLATSDSDRDLTTLIYAGLLRPSQSGELVPDLAASYEISADGLTYTFTLKKNLRWQDGKPLTAADVVYTIDRAKDPTIKSSKRANWEGVTARANGDRTVEFSLTKPYAGFLGNTTMGILPKHLWEKVRPDNFSLTELNTNPIGSGPYRITNVDKNDQGIPASYDLEPFASAASGKPKISKLKLIFYQDEKELVAAYRRGEIESLAAIAPETAEELAAKGAEVLTAPLPRIFAVFFNQNQATVLANKEVREALTITTNQGAVIDQALHGYATAINDPLPPRNKKGGASTTANLVRATELLTKAGWQKNGAGILEKKIMAGKKVTGTQRLAFTVTTANTPELKKIAELLATDWRRLGAEIAVNFYEPGDLTQNVIQTRKYDALIFGEVLGRDPDLFPYWHSSQRNYPGLNISMYANSKVDKLIDDARNETDGNKRTEKNELIAAEIAADRPAIFLYAPNFIYVLPTKVKRVTIPTIISPAERFLAIKDWYIATDRVWRIFASNQDIIK